jgi:hypothetical protein
VLASPLLQEELSSEPTRRDNLTSILVACARGVLYRCIPLVKIENVGLDTTKHKRATQEQASLAIWKIVEARVPAKKNFSASRASICCEVGLCGFVIEAFSFFPFFKFHSMYKHTVFYIFIVYCRVTVDRSIDKKYLCENGHGTRPQFGMILQPASRKPLEWLWPLSYTTSRYFHRD